MTPRYGPGTTLIIDTSALALLGLGDFASNDQRERAVTALAEVARTEGLQAPVLLVFELGNVIHRKRVSDLGGTQAERARLLTRLTDGIQFVDPTASTLHRAGEIAESRNISFYDATFLAHAEATEFRTLATADRSLHAHARALELTSFLLPNDLDAISRAYVQGSGAPPKGQEP